MKRTLGGTKASATVASAMHAEPARQRLGREIASENCPDNGVADVGGRMKVTIA